MIVTNKKIESLLSSLNEFNRDFLICCVRNVRYCCILSKVSIKFKGASGMTLGELIREKRIESGITQQQLADKIYVTRQTISKWELGKSLPDQVSLHLLETILQFKWQYKTEEEKRRKQMMFRIKSVLTQFVGLVFFGILFLPLRMMWIIGKRKWQNPFVQYVGIPLVIAGYSIYMYSLNTKAFYIVLVCTILMYIMLRSYFPLNRSKDYSN